MDKKQFKYEFEGDKYVVKKEGWGHSIYSIKEDGEWHRLGEGPETDLEKVKAEIEESGAEILED